MNNAPKLGRFVLRLELHANGDEMDADRIVKNLSEIGCAMANAGAIAFTAQTKSRLGCIIEARDDKGAVIVVNVAGALPD